MFDLTYLFKLANPLLHINTKTKNKIENQRHKDFANICGWFFDNKQMFSLVKKLKSIRIDTKQKLKL